MHNASRILNVGQRDMLVVGVNEYKGKFGVDIRFYYTDELNQLRPTARGARVPIAFSGQLLEALQEVLGDCEKTVQLPKAPVAKKKVVAKKTVRRKK